MKTIESTNIEAAVCSTNKDHSLIKVRNNSVWQDRQNCALRWAVLLVCLLWLYGNHETCGHSIPIYLITHRNRHTENA